MPGEKKKDQNRSDRFNRHTQNSMNWELIKYAVAGIYEIDFRNMRFTFVNDAMCDMTGYTREEFLAMNPADLTDEKGRKNFAKRTTQWLKGQKPGERVEYKLKTKNGRMLDVILFVTYTEDAAEKPFGATVIAHDITVRKKTARALKMAYDELENRMRNRTKSLEEKNASLEREIQKNICFQQQLKKEREKLVAAYRQRDFLSRQLVDLLERDRREIGFALHDQIGQMLTGISIQLEGLRGMRSADGKPLASCIEPIQILLRKTMQQTKDISLHLRPEILERFGLIHSVKEFIAEIQKYSRIRIYFYNKGFCENFRDGVKDLVIYRIIQESVTNALKHAQATEIFINLAKRNDYAFLTVEDNGSGFDYDKTVQKIDPAVKSLGITIMRERASLAGGVFRIDSSPGHGTCIQAEIPLSDTELGDPVIRDIPGVTF